MGSLRMQTLNIEAARKHAVELSSNYAPPPSGGGGTSTPMSLNTPDILNSLISITSNPFFDTAASAEISGVSSVPESQASQPHGGDEDKKVFATLEVPGSSNITSPSVPIVIVSPPPPPASTVQSLRSQFIKDSLKLTIQTKRKCSGKEELDVQAELESKVRKREEVEATNNPSNYQRYSNSLESTNKLTPEDEERRRRRRERNKIAATKCRNKKKEKTGLLVQESHTLESTNVTLKSEISKLEEERQRLMEVLSAHAPLCSMKGANSETLPVRISSQNGVSYSKDFNLMSSSPSPYYHIQHSSRHHHLPA